MPALARVIVEDDRREHVAVLGDGERRHLQLDRLVEQLVDAARAVEQRELGVQMKMDEFSTCLPNAMLSRIASPVTPTRSSTAASSDVVDDAVDARGLR